MLFEQAVEVFDLRARARGDALLARILQNVGIAALLACHRQDHRALALDHPVVDASFCDLVLHLANARQHAHQAAKAADLFHLRQLLGHVVEIEPALAHFLGDRLRLFGVDRLRGLLDQSDDVAHAQNAVGDAVGVKIIEIVELFAGADELDRLAGDCAHGQSRAAAPVAVRAGEHDAGDADALVKTLGQIHRVLTGETVGHQQNLMRTRDGLDLGHFGHQQLVDMRAACRVEQNDVKALKTCGLFGALGDLNRRLAGNDGQRLDADLAAENRKLLLRGRALHVERGHQHLALHALGQAFGDFGCGGGFTRALQAHHHDGERGGRIEIDRIGVGAQRLDEHVVDDLDDHLARRDRFDDIGADRPVAHLVGERAHHVERHIRLKQSAANLAQSRCDVLLAKGATARQLVKYAGELF